MISRGETHKDEVKLTFAKGAALDDPAGLFNASLGGNTRRAIDVHEGEQLDERGVQGRSCAPRRSSDAGEPWPATGTTRGPSASTAARCRARVTAWAPSPAAPVSG